MGKTVIATCRHHGETVFNLFPSGGRKCRKCNVEAVTKRRRKAIRLVKEEAGGACLLCGYNNCFDALAFHHKDPTQKELGIGSGNTVAIAKLREEVKKCVLVCSNCHAEIHAGMHPEYFLG